MSKAILEQPAGTDEASAVAQARAEVERLYQLEQEWSDKYLAASAELAEVERTAGASVLDGANASKLATQIGNHHGQLRLAESAIAEVRRRRIAAIRAVWQSEADALRAEAAELRKEADERQITTSRLLAELESFEGCRYVPEYELRQAEARPIPGVLRDLPALPPLPKTQALRDRADYLERKAEQIAGQAVRQAGQVVAFDRKELLAELDALGPMQIAPPRHAVLAWLDAGDKREQARLAKLNDTERQYAPSTRYKLLWRGGEIDQDSYIGPVRE